MNVLLDKRAPPPDDSNIDRRQERREAFAELIPWAEAGFVLQKTNGSSLHELIGVGALWMVAPVGVPAWIDFDPEPDPAVDHMQLFVVQHDWAAAFKGAGDFEEGDFSLPFDSCLFEFRISGRRVCAYVLERPDGKGKGILTFVQTRKCWVVPITDFILTDGLWKPTWVDEENSFKELPPFLAAHIRAICVSLEAEVATSEIVNRPAKVNVARIRRGKAPLLDYRVVYLNRRPRGEMIDGPSVIAKKRLHFRRGHWRHLTVERKTWVKWCLVGDPDLGFIDKEYRL